MGHMRLSIPTSPPLPQSMLLFPAGVQTAHREPTLIGGGGCPTRFIRDCSLRLGSCFAGNGLWTGKAESDSEVKTTFQYVLDLRQWLEDTCQLTHHEINKSSERYKRKYDKSRDGSFKVGVRVSYCCCPQTTISFYYSGKAPSWS